MTPAGLAALGADDWARVLPLARRVLRELDTGADAAVVRRLRDLPTGRLVGGDRRAELCRVLLADERRRRRLVELLDDAGELDRLAPRLGDDPTPSAAQGGTRDADTDPDAEARRARDQRRLRRLRDERDRARRQADGARARAAAAERSEADARAESAALREELTAARRALAEAAEERRRAVERERRRGRATAADLREQLRTVRRELEDVAARAQRRTVPAARDRAASAPRPVHDGPPPGPRAGRPTRLPETVAHGTAEAVDLLLEAGRLVLVDGYNVTRQHRPALSLEGQRDWLVRRLATLAAQRRVRPTVVFDGERGASTRPTAGAREVRVSFTPTGVTADDELVFAVEALPPDEPVLVVTDDRELTGRLRALGADVVGTGPFLWATPG
jgi:hypothetical protein